MSYPTLAPHLISDLLALTNKHISVIGSGFTLWIVVPTSILVVMSCLSSDLQYIKVWDSVLQPLCRVGSQPARSILYLWTQTEQ